MKSRLDRKNLSLLIPLTGFAIGTLFVGSSYGPVSAFIPFWASIFMLLTCLFVILGFDRIGEDEDSLQDAQTGSNERPSSIRVAGSLAWISAFVFLAYFFGLVLAAIIYTFCSMFIFGRKTFFIAFVTSACLGICLFGLFEIILEKELYQGLIFEYLAEIIE